VTRTRWLGAMGLSLYAAHAGRRALLGHPEHLLWMCHVGVLMIATGLLARAASLNALGTEWLVAGVPLWLADLAAGGEFVPTSVFTHGGGLVLGLAGLRCLGLPRGVWWKSALVLVALAAVSRLVTPAYDDVNLAFSALPASAGPATTLAVAAAAIAVSAAVFFAIERGLLTLGFTTTGTAC
jgi:hypothetical protein